MPRNVIYWNHWFKGWVQSGGSPLTIPDGESDPRTAPGDSWITRLAEFDAGLGYPVAIYLRVETAEYLDNEPEWEDRKPWCASVLFVCLAVDGETALSAIRSCGEDWFLDVVEDSPGRTARALEEVFIMYGLYATACEGVFADDNFDEAIEHFLIEAYFATGMPGFMLDKPHNRMGASGWDFLRGAGW